MSQNAILIFVGLVFAAVFLLAQGLVIPVFGENRQPCARRGETHRRDEPLQLLPDDRAASPVTQEGRSDGQRHDDGDPEQVGHRERVGDRHQRRDADRIRHPLICAQRAWHECRRHRGHDHREDPQRGDPPPPVREQVAVGNKSGTKIMIMMRAGRKGRPASQATVVVAGKGPAAVDRLIAT